MKFVFFRRKMRTAAIWSFKGGWTILPLCWFWNCVFCFVFICLMWTYLIFVSTKPSGDRTKRDVRRAAFRLWGCSFCRNVGRIWWKCSNWFPILSTEMDHTEWNEKDDRKPLSVIEGEDSPIVAEEQKMKEKNSIFFSSFGQRIGQGKMKLWTCSHSPQVE